MELSLLKQELAVISLKPSDPVPDWVFKAEFYSITKTPDELSLFCDADVVPAELNSSSGWRAFRIVGQIDLELSGMISSLALPLAAKQIPIFSISTHDTDYMVVRDELLKDATEALTRAGHVFV